MMEYFARHPTIANLLMIGFFAVGLTSLPSLQRATFPRIQADTVQISVVYPGATPDVVEEAICQRLEDAVDSVDSVAEMACESRESLATAKVEMTEGSDLDRFFSDVRVQVEAINDFPDGAESPVLSQIGRTDFVASLAITGPSDRTQLKSYAEVIKDRMQAFGGIPKVTIKGFSERQLRIEIPDETLREFNLSFADIARAIERQNVDRPVGTLTSKNAELLLRFDDQRTTIADLSDLVVVTAPNGGQIRLGNLATITDQFEKRGGLTIE
ncbi:MAG: efflux RND transporter permease subunit [Pseudomonadota bacterium]